MQRIFLVATLIAVATTTVAAQQNGNGKHKPPPEFGLEAQRIEGSFSGGKLEYNWKLPKFRLHGGGLFERTGGKAPFVANIAFFELSRTFAIRVEAGGHFKDSASLQIGLQANLEELIPKLKKKLESLKVAQLPGLAGKRPPHTFVGGESKELQFMGGLLPMRFEGRYVVIPGRSDVAEFQVWLSPCFGPQVRYDNGHFGIAAVYRWKVF